MTAKKRWDPSLETVRRKALAGSRNNRMDPQASTFYTTHGLSPPPLPSAAPSLTHIANITPKYSLTEQHEMPLRNLRLTRRLSFPLPPHFRGTGLLNEMWVI